MMAPPKSLARTNPSLPPPPSGVMNPKPFSVLKNLALPFCIEPRFWVDWTAFGARSKGFYVLQAGKIENSIVVGHFKILRELKTGLDHRPVDVFKIPNPAL